MSKRQRQASERTRVSLRGSAGASSGGGAFISVRNYLSSRYRWSADELALEADNYEKALAGKRVPMPSISPWSRHHCCSPSRT